MDLSERIRAYIGAMPAAVSGSGGHTATFSVASALVWGFDLTVEEAMPFLEEYNRRCSPAWNPRELLHKLRSADQHPPEGKGRGHLLQGKPRQESVAPGGPARAPVKQVKREEWAKINRQAIANLTSGLPPIDTAWFRRRSPVDVSTVTSGGFLDAVFGEGERVIIFTRYYSQGDFIWVAGRSEVGSRKSGLHGGFRLSDEQGTAAVASELPKTGRLGAWYLVQPVSGKWEIGQRVKDDVVKYTRRSEINVTRWAHFVLESDELEAEVWHQVVAALKLPIVALYTSGGRSIHALVREEVPTKGHWDAVKHQLERIVCPLGADPGAISAVRLSRLPGVFREGKEEEGVRSDGTKGKRYVKYARPQLQELIYLNPSAGYEAIYSLPEARA